MRPSPVQHKGVGALTKAPIRKPRPPKGARQIFKAAGRMEILRARNRHRDIMNLFPGDAVIYTKHDHNFLVTTGFLGVIYNNNYPALRFIAYIQEEYKDFELKYEFEEALPVKAIANVADWPALIRVVLVLVQRLVIVDNQLVMVLPHPEEKNEFENLMGQHKRKGIHFTEDVEEHQTTDRDHPHIGTELVPSSSGKKKISSTHINKHGRLLFRGTRGPEKDVNMMFKVREYKLAGVGRSYHFHIEEHLKQPPEEAYAPKEKDKKHRSFGFYYSTSILQHILSALEELDREDVKVHLAKSLCKWITIVDAHHSEAGIDEIAFDMSRVDKDILLVSKAPGDSQRALQKRLSVAKYARPVHIKRPGPPKMNFNLKAITASEKLEESLRESIYRPKHRLLTPDSVILHRRKRKILPLNGEYLLRSGGVNNTDFVQRRLKPVERLANTGRKAKHKYKGLEMAFCAGADKYFDKNPPNFLKPTKQFLAQRYKDVIEKAEHKHAERQDDMNMKEDGGLNRCSEVVNNEDLFEIITPYSKGAVAAKILLTDEREKKRRMQLANQVGRSWTPFEVDFNIS